MRERKKLQSTGKPSPWGKVAASPKRASRRMRADSTQDNSATGRNERRKLQSNGWFERKKLRGTKGTVPLNASRVKCLPDGKREISGLRPT